MAFYGKQEYWDERYLRQTKTFEWYQSYHGIRHLFTPYHLSASKGIDPGRPRRILEARSDRDNGTEPVLSVDRPALRVTFPSKPSCRVLIVGCGNSRLGYDMVRDGWTGGIVSADFSKVVIDQMKALYNDEFLAKMDTKEKPNKTRSKKVLPTRQKDPTNKLMEFVCADVVKGLPFDSESFDLIVCKGTLDAIATGAGSVANVRLMMHECHRLLRSGHGAMVVVTHGNPESRMVLMENEGNEWWDSVSIHCVGKPRTERRHLLDKDGSKYNFAYICRKRDQTFVGKDSSAALPRY